MLLAVFRVADIASMATSFTIAFILSARQASREGFEEFLAGRVKLSNLLLLICFACVWHLVFSSNGLYRSREVSTIGSEWGRVVKATAIGTLLLATFAVLWLS